MISGGMAKDRAFGGCSGWVSDVIVFVYVCTVCYMLYNDV